MQTPTIQRPKVVIKSIEEAFHRLLVGGSFYATVAAGLRRRPVPKEICASVGIICNTEADIGIELIYCQEFLESIDDIKYLEFVIEHECVHLLMKHLERYYSDPRLSGISEDMFNLASDLAVNTIITKHYPRVLEERSDGLWMPEDFGLGSELPMEGYAMILDAKETKLRAKYSTKSNNPATEEVPDLFNKPGVSPHLWGYKLITNEEGETALTQVTASEAKNSEVKQEANLGEYVEQCVRKFNKSQGELPSYVKEIVKNFVRIKKDIHWADVLKARVASGMRANRTRSMSRPSRRRWGLPKSVPKFPGVGFDYTYKVALMIDTSGSMSDGDLMAAKSTLRELLTHFKNSVAVHVIHADTKVHKIQQLTTIGEFDTEITGRGGTDFVGPIDHVEKTLNPDIILYFTDGWGRAPHKAPKAAIVWFISEGGKNPTKNLPEPYGEEVNVKY